MKGWIRDYPPSRSGIYRVEFENGRTAYAYFDETHDWELRNIVAWRELDDFEYRRLENSRDFR